MDTPCSVMFADLKSFGRISNQEAARRLLNPDYLYNGKPLADRTADRTLLSRKVVHATPGETPRRRYGDLASASLTLSARLREANGGGEQAQELLGHHYLGPAARAMRKALRDCGVDDSAYANALQRISAMELPNERERASLYLMLFVATGCLGNPGEAAAVVGDFVSEKLTSALHTVETDVGPGFASHATPRADTVLGLLRLVDGSVREPLHKLATSPEGTVIGSLPNDANGISDVDGDVSRRHLRIWREEGRWYAQGLGSTNGTVLLSGSTREASVVEPPRSRRARGATYPPVELLTSDILCLGATTRFLVMSVMA